MNAFKSNIRCSIIIQFSHHTYPFENFNFSNWYLEMIKSVSYLLYLYALPSTSPVTFQVFNQFLYLLKYSGQNRWKNIAINDLCVDFESSKKFSKNVYKIR